MVPPVGNHEGEPPFWNAADAWQLVWKEPQRQGCDHNERQQRRRDHLADQTWSTEDHQQGGGTHEKRRRLRPEIGHHHLKRLNRTTATVDSQQRTDLQAEDNHPDARHETRDHGIGHECDVTTESQHAQQDLNESTDHHGSHHQRQQLSAIEFPADANGCEAAYNPCHGDAHRPCWSAHLCRGSPE